MAPPAKSAVRDSASAHVLPRRRARAPASRRRRTPGRRPSGSPRASRVTRTAVPREQLLDVGRRHLALHGRIGREDDLPHRALPHPAHQPVEPERLRADRRRAARAGRRARGSGPGSRSRGPPRATADASSTTQSSAGVAPRIARRWRRAAPRSGCRTPRTDAPARPPRRSAAASRADLFRGLLQQMKGEALRRLPADPGQPGQLGDQLVDGAHRSERRRERQRRAPSASRPAAARPRAAAPRPRRPAPGRRATRRRALRRRPGRCCTDANGAAPVGRDPHQAAARRRLDGPAGQLGLKLLKPALHLLAELKELLKICHAVRVVLPWPRKVEGLGIAGKPQSTISKSNASAAVSRAGSFARNARSRSALTRRLGQRARRGPRAAGFAGPRRRPGAGAPGRCARRTTSSTAAGLRLKPLGEAAGSARRAPAAAVDPSTGAGVVAGQRLAQEAAPARARRRRCRARPPRAPGGCAAGRGCRRRGRRRRRRRRRRVAQDASLRGRLPPAAAAAGDGRRAAGCPGGRPRGTLAPVEHRPRRSTVRSIIAQRSSSVSTTSRGLALRRTAASLSVSSRSIRTTSPGSRAGPGSARAPGAGRLGQPLRLGAQLQHQQRAEHLRRAAHELGQVGARVDQPLHQREDAGRRRRSATSASSLGVRARPPPARAPRAPGRR